jgi:predicted ATPase
MRIAISGSHATGKSTLIAELARRLVGYTTIDEPFYILGDEGHTFGDPPSTEDFELLFSRSVSLLHEQRASNLLFDRSPADYLAYLTALDPGLVSADHIDAAATALATLDLTVFVPIERPDRVEAADVPRLRRRVDRILHDMLVDDSAGFDVRVITISGTVTQRVEQVLAEHTPSRGSEL